MNEDTLFFPVELQHVVGLSANEINALKFKGCRFYGRKTKIRWINEFLDRVTAEEESGSELGEHLQHSGGNKSGARVAKND